MRLVLFGPPGSGKGTQAARLSQRFKIPVISTGEIFREAVAQGNELGKKAKSILEKGQLVPDDITFGIVSARLSQEDCAKGFILDGFPRTTPQAEALEGWLLANNRRLDRAVALEVMEEELVARLSSRWMCKCGRLYNSRSLPATHVGLCDACGGRLFQREDDRPDTIRQRLAVYHKQTRPLLSFYKERNILLSIAGDRSPEEVSQKLEDALGDYSQVQRGT